MAFDPFGDFATRGYLRNHAGEKDLQIVKMLEHDSFSGGIESALKHLSSRSSITYSDVLKTHELLFRDVYPWAGQDRASVGRQEARETGDPSRASLGEGIVKGPVRFMPGSRAEVGTQFALDQGNNIEFMRNNPGEVMGSLAYAHPFLDGNGRTIMTVHGELAARAGIHIDWSQTNKQDYLAALTKELDAPGRHLDAYLKPFVREGAMGREERVEGLTTLTGLSVPPARQQPTLTVVAGPQGVGKTHAINQGHFGQLDVIDVNAIAREIDNREPQRFMVQAEDRAFVERQLALQSKTSFAVETSLSDGSALTLMDEARQAGFKVDLKFVGVDRPTITLERVALRSQIDGRSFTNDELATSFQRSMDALPDAMEKADRVTLMDNTGDRPRQVFQSNRETLSVDTPPAWAADATIEREARDLKATNNLSEKARFADRMSEIARASGDSHADVAEKSAELAEDLRASIAPSRDTGEDANRTAQQQAEINARSQQPGPHDTGHGR